MKNTIYLNLYESYNSRSGLDAQAANFHRPSAVTVPGFPHTTETRKWPSSESNGRPQFCFHCGAMAGFPCRTAVPSVISRCVYRAMNCALTIELEGQNQNVTIGHTPAIHTTGSAISAR